MGGTWHTFEDIKKVVVVVLILLVAVFVAGFSIGYKAGKGELIAQPEATPLPLKPLSEATPIPRGTPIPLSSR